MILIRLRFRGIAALAAAAAAGGGVAAKEGLAMEEGFKFDQPYVAELR